MLHGAQLTGTWAGKPPCSRTSEHSIVSCTAVRSPILHVQGLQIGCAPAGVLEAGLVERARLNYTLPVIRQVRTSCSSITIQHGGSCAMIAVCSLQSARLTATPRPKRPAGRANDHTQRAADAAGLPCCRAHWYGYQDRHKCQPDCARPCRDHRKAVRRSSGCSRGSTAVRGEASRLQDLLL